ncbi:hypothetical protein [Sandaracinobacteroides saxicola]|uniref:Uncharacterized protein n=1 Tax=Sandaracinobacteroides saxicola TaxID=2759707 RepID=A0A7G5IJX3_9SPHN|nr:hypothetical protein [Sandaracinobacteroides saxicola]QMW23665.1 hypothetical protein H3309_04015 [Sandaracinobacteroides saxicola]
MSLLLKIERVLRASGESPSRFGRRIANDPRLVHDLRRGRNVGPRLAQRIETQLSVVTLQPGDTPCAMH